jgi:hypothetical protein
VRTRTADLESLYELDLSSSPKAEKPLTYSERVRSVSPLVAPLRPGWCKCRPAPCAVQLPRPEPTPSRPRAALGEANVTVGYGGACRKGPLWFRPLRAAPFRIGCDSALETEGSTLEMAAENAAAGGPRSTTCFPHRRA